MEQFSSCYFCGDAVDASLDEYPVVPASVDPGTGERRTVVLCRNCKRKLDPVVEAVVDAVGDDAVSLDRSAPDGREREDRSEPGEDTRADDDTGESTTSDIGTTLGDDDDLLRPVGDDGNEETREVESDHSATGADESVESDGSDGDDPKSSNDERTYTSGQRAGGRPTGGDDAADGDEDGEKRELTLSRLENTNVMRLLQNREFPVEREDFVTVASSAYEVSPSHCEKVIDLAVKHDLLRESEGQLHAGPEWS